MPAPANPINSEINLLAQQVAQLQAIQAVTNSRLEALEAHFAQPASLYFVDPITGEPIMNFQALNDTNYAIPIKAANIVGAAVALPALDTFTIAGGNGNALSPGLFTIGFLADGVSPALLVNAAGVTPGTDLTATVADADGLTVATLTVDVVTDINPKAIVLDVANAQATVVQPATAPTPAPAATTTKPAA